VAFPHPVRLTTDCICPGSRDTSRAGHSVSRFFRCPLANTPPLRAGARIGLCEDEGQRGRRDKLNEVDILLNYRGSPPRVGVLRAVPMRGFRERVRIRACALPGRFPCTAARNAQRTLPRASSFLPTPLGMATDRSRKPLHHETQRAPDFAGLLV